VSDNDKVLMAVPRGEKGEELRVTLSEFKERVSLNIREWFKGHDGDMRPGKKGINIRESEFQQFVDAVDKAQTTGFGQEQGTAPQTRPNPAADDDIPGF
jgi:hypothetical protein